MAQSIVIKADGDRNVLNRRSFDTGCVSAIPDDGLD